MIDFLESKLTTTLEIVHVDLGSRISASILEIEIALIYLAVFRRHEVGSHAT
jgi:hypothetical protein